MKVVISDKRVIFSDDRVEAGVYSYDNPFKPYMHPLRTPAGHVLTVAHPADHRHHRGLMYALRCADLNFWEENPGSDQCGVERVLETVAEGDGGIVQRLRWEREDGALATYEETRRISVCRTASSDGFRWQWTSERTSLRDHRLILSEWSWTKADGSRVNYHGLGIRLPWCWSMAPCRTLEVDGVEQKDFVEAGGVVPARVRLYGRLDGSWKPDQAEVTLEQPQGQPCALYACGTPFAFLSLGPSNSRECSVSKGETFKESYFITVRDLP